MRTVRRVGDLRAVLAAYRREAATGRGREDREGATFGLVPTIGLVPTMGALHEGHLSLIRRARTQCDVVVVSLFVNPAQFDERADLARYPRDESRDAALAADAGADLLFAPGVEEVYPPGFATSVEVLGITDRFEGASRGAAHFRGVATVVTKLLCMTQPDIAYFGAKDAQQVVVIRRLVADLNLPVRIATCPTVREPDGLAMSSRNALLDPSARARALALTTALRAARELTDTGERSIAALIDAATAAMASLRVEPEYVAIVDPDSFEPLEGSLAEAALLVLAARVGSVRLIDNTLLEPKRAPLPAHASQSADPHRPSSSSAVVPAGAAMPAGVATVDSPIHLYNGETATCSA